MIKNVVFDLGQVLIEFEPLKYLKPYGFDKITNQTLREIIFYSEEWEDCNRGKYKNNSDLVEILCDKNPQYADKIKLVLDKNWVKLLYLKKDTEEFVNELKQKGFKIYILSNISEESYEFIKQFDFWRNVDGAVFSYQEKVCKPDVRIYEKLLGKYCLIPNQSIFIDDREDNIAVAKNLQMHGVLFRNLEETKKEVENLIVLGKK